MPRNSAQIVESFAVANDLIREFIPQYGKKIAEFKTPPEHEIEKRFGKNNDVYKAFKYVIEETEFGKALMENSGSHGTGYNSMYRSNSLLNNYWLKTAFMKLEEHGVSFLQN